MPRYMIHVNPLLVPSLQFRYIFRLYAEIAFPSSYVARLKALEEKFNDHHDVHMAGDYDVNVEALPLPFSMCCITG